MTDEIPAEPRVVWSHEPKEGTWYRAILRRDGGHAYDYATSQDGMQQPKWEPVVAGWPGPMLKALLADHAVLQAAAPPPNMPAPPSALSAFVAENPGFSTSELLNRTPPNHRTWTKLHKALLADPQISWQEAGKNQRKSGWYAVFGKPEADPVERPTDDELVALVRKYPHFTTNGLRDRVTGDTSSYIGFFARLEAHPGIGKHLSASGKATWHLVEPEPDPEFVGKTLEELVRDNPGSTTEELRELRPSPDLIELAELAESLAATPGVRIVKMDGSLPCVWFSTKPPDDALVDLVREHPNQTADELWLAHSISKGTYTAFVDDLRAHPGICLGPLKLGRPIYQPVEPTP